MHETPLNTRHHRRSIRQRDYDYTQSGAYFVTLCTHERLPLFGAVVSGEMVCNVWGQIVQACWDEIPAHYPMVELDAFVVMPNHVHGIIVITGDSVVTHSVGAQYIAPLPPTQPSAPAPTQPSQSPKRGMTPNNVTPNSLGSIVRTFKAAVTRQINRLPDAPDHPLWQRNYYEHIIRNEAALNQIRAYIVSNPAKWAEDSLYTE